MGNFLSGTEKTENDFVEYTGDKTTTDETVKVEFTNMDEYTKEQLAKTIQALKTKNINLPENLTEKMKDIELENTQLIPMCLELYQHMFAQFGEYVPNKDKDGQKFKKNTFFVKPKFNVDDVKKSIEAPVVNISSDLNMTLMEKGHKIVNMKNDDISLNEFTESFGTILTKKDMMGITKRILKDMPQYLRIRFVNVYNQILKNSALVNNISIGRASYVYKVNKHGSTSDINSFRQIVTIPNAVNHLHRILNIRLTNYINSNKIIDTTIQKGGIGGQKFSIFEQYFKIKNVLRNANLAKKTCAVLFLDVSNAFGNLDRTNLYKILDFYQVDQYFTNYLKEFYRHFEYYVSSGDIKTDTFKWKNGLIQGCSLSPLLFVLALNYVLTYLDNTLKSTHGYDIDGVNKILFTAFMDDICIICKDADSLELVYNKLVELLTSIGLPINESKSAMMLVNNTAEMKGNISKIQKVNTFKYLGEYLSNDGSSTESYVQFMKMVTRKLMAIDKKTMPNNMKYDIFQKCAVPWIQRKTMVMYDVGMGTRLKMISIVKPYLEKWGYVNDTPNLFSNVVPVINDSKDAIISQLKDIDFDDDLQQNIDISNYVLKDTHIKLEYNQINDEFELDDILEKIE